MLRPGASEREIPQATAELAWKVHRRGTDEMRVRDALGPLFTDADFTTGPFADFNGAISDIDVARSKLTVLVNIFGRETPVELELGQVAKL